MNCNSKNGTVGEVLKEWRMVMEVTEMMGDGREKMGEGRVAIEEG